MHLFYSPSIHTSNTRAKRVRGPIQRSSVCSQLCSPVENKGIRLHFWLSELQILTLCLMDLSWGLQNTLYFLYFESTLFGVDTSSAASRVCWPSAGAEGSCFWENVLKKSLKALNCNIIQLQIPPGIRQKRRAPTYLRRAPATPSKPSDLLGGNAAVR